MKTKLFLSALILASSSIYSSELPIVRVKSPTIERESYEGVLRVIDPEMDELTDKKMDEIRMMAFYEGNNEKDILDTQDTQYSDSTENEFHVFKDVMDRGIDAYNGEELQTVKSVNMGPSQRIYFGNGNTVQDIVYLNKEKYNTKKNKLIEEDKEKYVIEGKYIIPYLTEEPDGIWEGLRREINPLDMTVTEYNEKVKGKPNKEVLTFLQDKLSQGDIKTYIEDGKLYTKDGKGKKWPVLWDMKPIRWRTGSKFEEIVWEKIQVHLSNSERGSAFGNMTYSKDGSTYLEDGLDYNHQVKINARGVFNYKPDYYNKLPSVEEYLSQEGVDLIVEDYSKDRDTMTEGDFNNKWRKVKTDYFEDRYKLSKGELTEEKFAEIWNPVIDKEALKEAKEEVHRLEEACYGVNHWGAGYQIKNSTDLDEMEGIFNSAMKNIEESEVKELTDYYNVYKALLVGKKDFYNKSKAVLLNSDIEATFKSKKLTLFGQGRVDGTIDMGDGFNRLVITEPTLGKYGSNIIFGPYSQLKNINVLEAGKAFHLGEGNGSISGEYSIMVDIDENIKNSKGEIDQHLFKNSNPDILIKPSNRFDSDFKIGVIVSRLNDDAVLNMGRKLYSEGKKTYDLTLVSDSIAHKLVVRDKEEGIIDVKVKDSIDGLSKDENEVYRSIKNANAVGALSPTLTTSNKTTIFGGVREEEALNELKMLTDDMSLKNIYSQLGKVSKNEVDNFTYLLFNKEKKENKNNDVYVNGGSISNRMVEDSFKGDTYSGYGLYQVSKENFSIGAIFGGSSSNYEEVVDDSFDVVSTNSKIKGTSAYLGGYIENDFQNNFSSISGIGFQYGEYETIRNLKNNFQNSDYKSKTNVNNINVYTGLMYNIPLENEMNIEIRGIISYDFVNQNKIEEDKDHLSMNVNAHNYNFLDGEIGLKLNKVLYSENSRSELSGGIYYGYGLMGYDDNDVSARINNSSSDFVIKGNNNEKDTITFSLDYNVIKDSGLTYGILCGYSKNDEKVDIKTGINIGYKL